MSWTTNTFFPLKMEICGNKSHGKVLRLSTLWLITSVCVS